MGNYSHTQDVVAKKNLRACVQRHNPLSCWFYIPLIKSFYSHEIKLLLPQGISNWTGDFRFFPLIFCGGTYWLFRNAQTARAVLCASQWLWLSKVEALHKFTLTPLRSISRLCCYQSSSSNETENSRHPNCLFIEVRGSIFLEMCAIFVSYDGFLFDVFFMFCSTDDVTWHS